MMYLQSNSGLGDAQKAQLTQQASAIASTAVAGAAAAHLLPAAAAGPIGLAIAGVGFVLTQIFGRKGPQQKIASTRIVDQVEPELQRNLVAYQSGPRTRADQLAALANFDYAWEHVRMTLSDPALGEPGRRGIRDRDRGGQWDWFAMYRDPIAADTPVEASFVLPGVLPGLTSQTAEQFTPWLWPAALILAGVLL